ncbi:PucR family transcriptional regulator [Skermania sp. ID1734]|nr:PucR family transcriptional regulator [Skermania sp. ID1734]
MPLILAEVRQHLAIDYPDFAEFLDGDHPEIRYAATVFIRRLVDIAHYGVAAAPESADSDSQAEVVLEEIGRRQFQEGRELSELLAAYQVGARAAWHHVSATALELELAPHILASLAEAVFMFVDQFSANTARGYVHEQATASAAREHQREQLAQLLLSDRADDVQIRAAAESAGWRLPKAAAVVIVEVDDPDACRALDLLDMSCLPIRRPECYGMIVPDAGAPGQRERLRRRLAGVGAVVGNTVPLRLLPASMGLAALAMHLHQRGIIPENPVFTGDHLDTIIANRDERLLGLLREQVLAPLEHLTEGARERLIETLAAWLRHMGDRQAIANDLHIHPQTVRYRINQLRELFGADLDSARFRARLFLALEWGAP